MRTPLLLLALLLPTSAFASTTVVDSDKELAWLERQKSVDGTVIVRVPGLTSLSLPRLASVGERLEIAVPDLVSMELPALRQVGADLNIGCAIHPRNEWETRGPLSPLKPLDDAAPSFADGPPQETKTKSRDRAAAGPARLALPKLESVGGGLSVCSPGVLGLDAPKLKRVGTDLQFFAGASWDSVTLPSLTKVASTLFLWLDGTNLTLRADTLAAVGAAVQGGGHGTLSLHLPALETAAGIVVGGSRRLASGAEADRPSLTLEAFDLPRLVRASQRMELNGVAGISELVLPALERTASIRIVDLPDLTSLHLPKLPTVEKSVVLGALPALSILDLPLLRTVGERLQIGGLGMVTLDLDVEQVGSLVLKGQRSKVIRADKLTSVGAMLLEDIGLAELVSFPAMTRVETQLLLGDSVALGGGSDLPRVADDDGTLRVFEAPKLRVVGKERKDGLTMRRMAFSVVKLSALTEVHGDLAMTEMPALTHVELPRLQMVEGKLTVSGSKRLEVLQFPALEKIQILELVALTGLKRVVARRLDAQVRQTSGTLVASLEVGP